MKTAIVWFTTDLRLHDNETMLRAIESADKIIPVYCLNIESLNEKYKGLTRLGKFRAKFLIESLHDLHEQLQQLNSGLLIVKGRPEVKIPKLVWQYGVSKVFAKREVAPEERYTQSVVEQELWKLNCTLETYSTSTLYHPADLPFATKDIPEVFTKFRTKLEKEGTIRKPLPAPTEVKSPRLDFNSIPTLTELGFPNFEEDRRSAFPFKGGEQQALKRLHYYLHETHLVKSYKETRNQMVGTDYSSKFSAWLAMGSLSPRLIYAELKKYESAFGANESTYWLYFELVWRDFFRYMMKKHQSKFFKISGLQNKKYECIPINPEKLNDWINGTTGNDFIDANMRELKHTGFMSNRGRQNVASYFCHDLKFDWRIGAAYFEQQLIDYDVCSNYGNWAYIAGVGNDPRPDRYFNTQKQADVYDAKFELRMLWL